MNYNAIRIFNFIWVLFFYSGIIGQNYQPASDRLQDLSYNADIMVNVTKPEHRVKAHDLFYKEFISILSDKNTYQYPFTELIWISKIEPDDKSFRIFTWEIKNTDSTYQYYGVIQKSDGSLFELKNGLDTAEDIAYEEFSPENWLGGLYYKLMKSSSKQDGTYYLIFGINKWKPYENVKMVDVLFFDKSGSPIFGKPVFAKDKEATTFFNRLFFNYASDANMTVNYNEGLEMIIFDHLIPKMSRSILNKSTLVPDGSYSAYEWNNKYWKRIEKLENQVMDSAPRPKPILNERAGKNIIGN